MKLQLREDISILVVMTKYFQGMIVNIKRRNNMAFDSTSFSDQNLTHGRLSKCKVTCCFIRFVNKNCRQEKSSGKSAMSGQEMEQPT